MRGEEPYRTLKGHRPLVTSQRQPRSSTCAATPSRSPTPAMREAMFARRARRRRPRRRPDGEAPGGDGGGAPGQGGGALRRQRHDGEPGLAADPLPAAATRRSCGSHGAHPAGRGRRRRRPGAASSCAPARNDEHGRMDLDEVRSLIRPRRGLRRRARRWSASRTRTTSATAPPCRASYTAEVAAIAHDAGAALHIDGARIFNAADRPGDDAGRAGAGRRFGDASASRRGCPAPIGSLICGSGEFIAAGARATGAWSAAACARSASSPRPASWRWRRWSTAWPTTTPTPALWPTGLATIPGIRVDPALVQTNILFFEPRTASTAPSWRGACASAASSPAAAPGRMRMVTHYGIERGGHRVRPETVREVRHRSA